MKVRGFVLIAGLVLLAAVSLLALVAASSMLLQTQMASNFTQDAKALEHSAIAMSYASAWLDSRANHEREEACISNCLLPVAIHNAGEIPALAEYENAAWWRSNAVKAGINPATGEILASYEDLGTEPPHWILEELHFQSAAEGEFEDGTRGVGYYRILGRGTGVHPASIAVIESIVARPWGGDYRLNGFPPGYGPENFCTQFDQAQLLQLDCGRMAWRQRR